MWAQIDPVVEGKTSEGAGLASLSMVGVESDTNSCGGNDK
jgi:hypothetical protein